MHCGQTQEQIWLQCNWILAYSIVAEWKWQLQIPIHMINFGLQQQNYSKCKLLDFYLIFLIVVNCFIIDQMCICVTVIDIMQPFMLFSKCLPCKMMQSVFRFFVWFFMSLHCEDSHTMSFFIKSCSHHLWHIESQNVHVETFISSWISFVFCEKTAFTLWMKSSNFFSWISTSSISVIARNGEFFSHKRRPSHKSNNVLVSWNLLWGNQQCLECFWWNTTTCFQQKRWISFQDSNTKHGSQSKFQEGDLKNIPSSMLTVQEWTVEDCQSASLWLNTTKCKLSNLMCRCCPFSTKMDANQNVKYQSCAHQSNPCDSFLCRVLLKELDQQKFSCSIFSLTCPNDWFAPCEEWAHTHDSHQCILDLFGTWKAKRGGVSCCAMNEQWASTTFFCHEDHWKKHHNHSSMCFFLSWIGRRIGKDFVRFDFLASAAKSKCCVMMQVTCQVWCCF